MNIISEQFAGIIDALQDLALNDLSAIHWERTPVRINGVWHAKVIL